MSRRPSTANHIDAFAVMLGSALFGGAVLAAGGGGIAAILSQLGLMCFGFVWLANQGPR